MKLMKLQKLNNALKKYSSLILSSLFLFTKKENLSNVLLYSVMSLLGYFLMKKENGLVKTKDWKEFINNEIRNKDNESEFTEDNLSEIESDLNNNINELKKMMKKNKEDVLYDDDDEYEDEELDLDDNENHHRKINKIIDRTNNEKVYPDNIENLSEQYTRKKRFFI